MSFRTPLVPLDRPEYAVYPAVFPEAAASSCAPGSDKREL
jgi:hypothetical protein